MAPATILNLLFFVWIGLGFRKTINYLKTHKKEYKYAVMFQMAVTFFSCIVVALFVKIADSIQMSEGDYDENWKAVWFWEKVYFIIFSLFTLAMLIILRPSLNLKSLTEIDELLDNTFEVTEIPESTRQL